MNDSLDLRPVLPALVVTLTGLGVLMLQAFAPNSAGKRGAAVGIVGLVGALGTTLYWAGKPGAGAMSLAGIVVLDDYAVFFHVLILASGAIAFLLSPQYLRSIGRDRGEYYALALFAIVGMLGLVSGLELISLFVALEAMSVSLYALAGFRREDSLSLEAAAKYFVTGAFASAFLLYGIAFIYGATGNTALRDIASGLTAPDPNTALLALAGVGLLLVGVGFKAAVVPFHMWAPDVYQGSPTTVSGFMAAVVKVAAFALLLRVFATGLPGLADHWQPALALLAVVTIVLGNLGALAQSHLKRMLAYSSVAHAGYLLIAIVAPTEAAATAILFYLVGYAAMSLAGFGALAALAHQGREPTTLEDLAGLGQRRPLFAAGLTVTLVSLTGLPVSAGFVGKFFLFRAAVDSGHAALALLGVLMSVVSAYYYLRVVVAMYMRPPEGDDTWGAVGLASGVALALCAAVILGLGIYPDPVLEFARTAALALR